MRVACSTLVKPTSKGASKEAPFLFPMQPHDWLWIASLAVGALNAWQNVRIQNAILGLKLELSERIADAEGDLKELRAMVRNSPR